MKSFIATIGLLCVCIGGTGSAAELAELSETQIAGLEKQARTDAEKESDEKFWALATFAGSTFLGPYFSIPALGGAYYYQPPPPAHRFIGKSQRYKEIYTLTYKSAYRRAALRGVLIGGLGGSALYYYNRRYGITFFRSW